MPRTSVRAGKRSKEEATSFALGHKTRIEILSALNEREASAGELAELIGEPLASVSWHLGELLRSNSIEVADVVKVGNHNVTIYRAVASAYWNEEEFDKLTYEEKQATYSLIIQNSGAEALASLWSGKISDERQSWLTWNWFEFDAEGWDAASEIMAEAWSRLQQAEADSAARKVAGGGETRAYICNLQAYPRGRDSSRQ